MYGFLKILQVIILLNFLQIFDVSTFGLKKKTWNYELVSIGANSSTEDKLKVDVSLEQISRGVFGISGTIDLFEDIERDDNVLVEARVYRSASGSSEYKVTPFTVPKQHLFEFFDTFYKDLLMPSLKDCSDLPQIEDKFQPPLKKKTFTLNSCVISNEGMPEHMLEGFYKITVIGDGKIVWVLEGIVKIEQDI